MPSEVASKSYERVQDQPATAKKRLRGPVHDSRQNGLRKGRRPAEPPAKRARNTATDNSPGDVALPDDDPSVTRTSSLLLDLPPELRNHIYDFLAAGAVVRMSSERPGLITDGRPILSVSRAVRGEYLDVLYKTARIEAEIFDFSFTPLASFLQKLDERTLHLLRRTRPWGWEATPGTRSITVILVIPWSMFLDQTCAHRLTKKLHHWLIDCTDRSGTNTVANVEYSYEVKVKTPPWMPGDELDSFKRHLLECWPKPDGSRFFDELIKIIAAFDRAHEAITKWTEARLWEHRRDHPTTLSRQSRLCWTVKAKEYPCSAIWIGKEVSESTPMASRSRRGRRYKRLVKPKGSNMK